MVVVAGFLHLTGAQQLADNNCHGIPQCDEYDVEHIADGTGNILGGDYVQASDGITL